MKPVLALATLSALGLASCRGRSESPTAGMNMTADTGLAAPRQPVQLTPGQVQAMGVTYTVAERGPLQRIVRTVGKVAVPESRLADVTTKIDGFVEQVFVDATGMAVRRGQPLLTLYSPMLVAAQEELVTAKQLAASADSSDGEAWRQAHSLVEAARRRLSYWDISAEQIEQLERTGEVTKTLTLVAPFDGVVLEKMVVTGQSVMAGMKLYRLADLSTVWVEGEVFEQDVAFVRVGALARVELATYPGRAFTGRVGFVYPTVDEQSRTVRVRIVLSNSGGALKPGMYGTLYFDTRLGERALTVPAEAVVMTGERNLVFVVGPAGALEPRDVTLGVRAGDRLEVLSGLREGERIVASANFLVDAESRLGSGKGMADMPGMETKPGKVRP
jgi:membrane fusion protein, copper/silver efflux system